MQELLWSLNLLILAVVLLVTLIAIAVIAYNRFIVRYETEWVAWPDEADFIEPIVLLPDNPKRVRILSIDGGAIHGLASLEILHRLEQESGRSIAEMFDFVAGTSTGAIIATQLLMQDEHGNTTSAEQIIQNYHQLSDKILSAPLYHRLLTLNGLVGPLFLNRTKFQAARLTYGKLRMGDLVRPLLIPLHTKMALETRVFRNWELLDANTYLAPLVSAATSVPALFPSVRLLGSVRDDAHYGDAGPFLNSPSHYAFVHARVHNPQADQFILVSVGSRVQVEMSEEAAKYGGIIQWARPLMAMAFNGQSDVNSELLTHLENVQLYIHLNTFHLHVEIPKQWDSFNKTDAAAAAISHAGKQYATDNHDKITQIVELLTAKDAPPTMRPDSSK